MLENLDFGRFAAEADILRDELEVFVATRQSKSFRLPQHRIIIGRKGSGKTALEIDLSREYKSKYDFILPIDAEAIRFNELAKTFLELESEAGSTIELRKSLTNIWEYSILTSCMIILLNKTDTNIIDTFTGPGATINNFLRKEGLLKKRIYDLLIDNIENIFKIFLGEKGKATSEIIKAIDNYPLDLAEFEDACNAMQEILNDRNGMLVTFDRIDKYFETAPHPYKSYKRNELEHYALKSYLAGLVQAVYNISISSLGRTIDFKVFLPEDKYEVIESRDLDKIKEFVFKIRWTPDDLREFIARRIAYSLKIRDTDGNLKTNMSDTWHKVFPRTIVNKQVSSIPENIDEYLLRHTQYKPRDLQNYCAKAKDLALTELSTTSIIPEDIVRRAVREITRELVDNLFIEYSYDYPFLKRLIEQFRKVPNILDYNSGFAPLVHRFTMREAINYSLNELVDLLFKIGFVGGVTTERTDEADFAPTRKVKGKTYAFYFAYIDSSYDIRDCEKIAIHPIFNEFLHLKINTEIIVG